MGFSLYHERGNFFDYVIRYDGSDKKGDYIDTLTFKDLVELYELIKKEIGAQ